ncbi:hypothetical protein [Flavilitoribacter nigricans]|uniref:Uncharacterized protein n=1 Tax=Flavilitoribacter nigricans (strain ATCC 23147 / DSM 23189 / NBRC 102662 / NCIMB 1420 / SS-2) TaxID=1122177 RepID=A0A2D0N436_FLAN2|nr:hypothetical protein [Flavilitoribacter nigricans]PHN03255.1 hypothetical protein CRP01_28080 [Flavilitoribacter nigricans DSM 23189 = NBRC 102662]
MAKKRFTDNFESLFGDPIEDTQSQEQATTSDQGAPEADETADADKKKISGKDFTDSLQSFLSETFEESFERQMAEVKKQEPAEKPKRPKRRRSSLDMLIRNTVEPSKIEIEGEAPKRRRITLTFEPQKLEKLRNIARVERAMLKDIINDIVGEYIQKYETGKEDKK